MIYDLLYSNKQLQQQSTSSATDGAAKQETEMQAAEAAFEAASAGFVEPGMRMVLVRDIGIQVSGDSPNLNLARKFKPPSAAAGSHGAGSGNGGATGSGITGSSGATGSSSHHHHHHHHRHKPSNSH